MILQNYRNDRRGIVGSQGINIIQNRISFCGYCGGEYSQLHLRVCMHAQAHLYMCDSVCVDAHASTSI